MMSFDDSGSSKEDSVVNFLKELDLTYEEIQIYLSLIKNGPSKASQISNVSKEYRVKTYKILGKLRNIGLVYSSFSSPAIFYVASPEKSLRKLIDEKRTMVEKLDDSIEKVISYLDDFTYCVEPQNMSKFYVVTGTKHIYETISKMIKLEERGVFYLILPKQDLAKIYHSTIPSALQDSKQRNLDIRLLTYVDESFNSEYVSRLGFESIKTTKLPSQGRTICSESQVMISEGFRNSTNFNENLSSAMITNSKEIVDNVRFLCDNLWKKGKTVTI